ncbi:hypothetical protein BC567DRAFT_69115 [Phyllosticta citribraziliensis]
MCCVAAGHSRQELPCLGFSLDIVVLTCCCGTPIAFGLIGDHGRLQRTLSACRYASANAHSDSSPRLASCSLDLASDSPTGRQIKQGLVHSFMLTLPRLSSPSHGCSHPLHPLAYTVHWAAQPRGYVWPGIRSRAFPSARFLRRVASLRTAYTS